MPRLQAPFLMTALGLVMLGWSDDIALERAVHARAAIRPAPPAPTRKRLDGAGFPDGVLALTWDDGPDVQTLSLARYLHSQKVAGTFFVVGHWVEGLSEEPGVGPMIYETGYEHLPILADLVALGHRLGAHTESHVRLAGASSTTVVLQVGNALRAIDPWVPSELRMFRAPGGMWDQNAALALDAPFFAELRGPIHWDIDGKDWEGSLYCPADQPPADCEPSPIHGRSRLRAEVVARRYLSLSERLRHGIVLMHDRVGDVGSDYALKVAKQLIPALAARGFVFASPLLSFGALSKRTALPTGTDASLRADVDGDGHADACFLSAEGVRCMTATDRGRSSVWSAPGDFVRHGSFQLGDLNRDGRADLCAVGPGGVSCALSDGRHFKHSSIWSEARPDTIRLADIDSDGRADLCAITPSETDCGLAL